MNFVLRPIIKNIGKSLSLPMNLCQLRSTTYIYKMTNGYISCQNKLMSEFICSYMYNMPYFLFKDYIFSVFCEILYLHYLSRTEFEIQNPLLPDKIYITKGLNKGIPINS